MGFVNRDSASLALKDAYPMQFEVGSDGVARKLGVAGEQAMGEEKLWFGRIA